MRDATFAIVLVTSLALVACATWPLGEKAVSSKHLVPASVRLAAIERAQVWKPTDVAAMNLRNGPGGADGFGPQQQVSCNYLDKKMSGQSPKFACIIPPKDELKVKYGRDNGEVFAEVAASRLLWALGFYAERMYPVRVSCHGCPSNITDTEFASIQRKYPGRDLDTKDMVGWAWPELDQVDASQGGAPKAQRDALTLLAVFIQHTDSKSDQQRLICEDAPKPTESESCVHPIMLVHDLGQTFGSANMFNRDRVGSVNLSEWSHMAIWKDASGCVANLPQSQTGTLNNPVIREGGRKFLADLLTKLDDQQIHDLFEVARFPERVLRGGPEGTTVDQWVAAFKHKRDEISSRACPN